MTLVVITLGHRSFLYVILRIAHNALTRAMRRVCAALSLAKQETECVRLQLLQSA